MAINIVQNIFFLKRSLVVISCFLSPRNLVFPLRGIVLPKEASSSGGALISLTWVVASVRSLLNLAFLSDLKVRLFLLNNYKESI